LAGASAPETAALVFAPARNPGGRFRNGAKAQEEDIARASALYVCLTAMPEFFAHHRAHTDLRYSDHVIYGPAVPVFRDNNGSLLGAPYQLSFRTAAAPNHGAIASNQPSLWTACRPSSPNGCCGWPPPTGTARSCSGPGAVAYSRTLHRWSLPRSGPP
jgi:uncharacterized protein (TIGR02452 family)